MLLLLVHVCCIAAVAHADGSFIHKVVEDNKISSNLFESCKAKGECFSGAWLGTVRHLLENVLIERKFPNEDIPASQSTLRCEDASFFFFHHMFEVKKDPNPSWGMSPIQTVDLLDFSVLHLSTLERLQGHCIPAGLSRRHRAAKRETLNKQAAQQLQTLRKTTFGRHKKQSSLLRKRAMADVLPLSSRSQQPFRMAATTAAAGLEEYFSRTLVIMPFLVTTVGESGTTVANKKAYFKLCFDSIFPLFRNILGAVISTEDQEIMKNARPFREVLLLNERRNDCELPMLALLAVKRMFKTSAKFAASFDFIYFTEGDQVLFGRNFPQIFSFLTANPFTVLTPHRLVLAPKCVLESFNRSVSEIQLIPDTQEYSCCMDTSSHGLSRTHWKHLSSPQATVVQLFGMSVVAGNGDLFSQNYRICNVTKRVQACPSAVRFLDYGTGSGEALIFSNHMRQQAREHATLGAV